MSVSTVGRVVRRIASRVGPAGVVLAACYPCLLVTALIPTAIAFLAVAVLSYVAEWRLSGRSWFASTLDKHGLPVAQRFVIREAAAVTLLARAEPGVNAALAALLGGVLVVQLLHGVVGELQARSRDLYGYRYAWRNLPADGLPDEWPRPSVTGSVLFRGGGVRSLLNADIPLVVGAALVAYGLPAPTMLVLAVVAVLLALVIPVRYVLLLRGLLALPAPEEARRRLQAAIRRLAPEVAVYFSSPPGSTYQLNVWLPTLNRSRRSTLIILGEEHHLSALGDTDLPAVVLPTAQDVSMMHPPTLRAALFPTNVIKNNQMLRLVGIRSSFIGHGDSDKAGSFNPLSRVYDEIWVAGEAGRARYARTREGIRPEQVKLVGRPQLTDIEQARTAGAVTPGDLTVLYAPTWEGFFEGSDYSSVVSMGEDIVRTLVALDRPVRILFKGHPATGTRVRAYRAAVARIEGLVANAGNGSAVVADTAGLYGAFNEADMLVTDISSVANDFLYSAKPLIVTNPAGRDDAAFVAEFPLTEAAYRLGPDCASLEEIVRSAVDPDPLRETRLRMRTHLLGDAAGDPVERFLEEIDRLVDRNTYTPPAQGLRRLALLSEERGGGFAEEDQLGSRAVVEAEAVAQQRTGRGTRVATDEGGPDDANGVTPRGTVPAEGEW